VREAPKAPSIRTALDLAISREYELDAGVPVDLPARSPTSALPGLGSMAALMLTAVLTAWLGIAGPITANIKEWQTLIAAAVASIAAWIAWSNVRKQMELQRKVSVMTLLGREEDRMEKALPGLREANDYLKYIRHTERSFKTNPEKDKLIHDKVFKRCRQTEENLRQSIIECVSKVLAWNSAVELAQTRPPTAPGPGGVRKPELSLEETEAKLELARHDLRKLQQQTASKIKTYERRLPVFRSKLEEFFAER
jgi:hypothetical protein